MMWVFIIVISIGVVIVVFDALCDTRASRNQPPESPRTRNYSPVQLEQIEQARQAMLQDHEDRHRRRE